MLFRSRLSQSGLYRRLPSDAMKNIKFKVLLTALSAVILLSVTSPVYGQNTLRKLPSVAKKSKKKTAKVKDLATDVRQVPADTVTAGIEKTVTVSGYEKPLRASKETVLVTNRDSVRALDELTLLIEYKTTDGRMLHKRTVKWQSFMIWWRTERRV